VETATEKEEQTANLGHLIDRIYCYLQFRQGYISQGGSSQITPSFSEVQALEEEGPRAQAMVSH